MVRLLLVLVLLAYGSGFLLGIGWGGHRPQSPYLPPITVEQAEVILIKATYSHQYYIDNPQYIQELTPLSTVEFHQECIDRYNQIWDLIQRLAND